MTNENQNISNETMQDNNTIQNLGNFQNLPQSPELEQVSTNETVSDEIPTNDTSLQNQVAVEEGETPAEKPAIPTNNEPVNETSVEENENPIAENDNTNQTEEELQEEDTPKQEEETPRPEEELKDKQSLLEKLQELINQNVLEIKDQVEQLKSQFYSLYNEEQKALRKVAEDAAEQIGEKLTDWQPVADEIEVKFKETLNVYKSKRNDAIKKMEEELNNNLLRKENILAQLKDMSDAESADVMDNVKKVKELQAEWKTIGHIPPQKTQEINKQYTAYLEKFYDLVKINFELRDLDFKKNLELKTLLCEAAEKLKENPSVIEASRALQLLHEEWAEIGPVAKDLRESIWARFKEASTVINKRHQTYFEELHAKEEENLKNKQAIIEKLKEIKIETLTSSRAWNEATDKITALQDEWRTYGFAPKKFNTAIYEEYRTLCNDFFKARATYFKDIKEMFAGNLAKKRSLVEKVDEIIAKINEHKDNNEWWKNATDQIMAFQKEWRTIGTVTRKYSDDVWKKFSIACDEFFTQKRELQKEAKNETKRIQDSKVLESGDKSLLIKMRDNLQQQIKTAENNILFFSGKSTTANKLVDDMQKKIDDLKNQLNEIKEKLSNTASNSKGKKTEENTEYKQKNSHATEIKSEIPQEQTSKQEKQESNKAPEQEQKLEEKQENETPITQENA